MKNFKKITSILLLAISVSFVSCGDDDDAAGPIIPGPPTGVDIRYEVIVSANMIDAIKYDNGNDQMLNGDVSVENPLLWSKTIVVFFSDLPYNVKTTVDFANMTNQPQTYTLNIYENGELVDTTNGSVPADDPTHEGPEIVTQTIQYDVTE